MAEDGRTLKGVIENCDNPRSKDFFKERLNEAERLAKSLFDHYIPLPYFTPHDASHCEAVEKYLNQIIWGTEEEPLRLSEYYFVPTPEEAMYLLSAAWLHDIGMWYGIREGETPNDLTEPEKVMDLRREHEIRTVRYIHEVWKEFCSWDGEQKTWLSNICAYHRRHHPISTFDPAQVISKRDGRPIRLVVLAGLLRLADACHEDQSRAPGRLMELYKSLGMPQETAAHWERAKLIAAVHFDHTRRKIILTGCCPPKKFDFGLSEFDLAEIVDIVQQDIEEELRSVQQVLLRYPNALFGEVTPQIAHPFDRGLDEEKQYLAVWPYLLEKPSGSTEAAAALAQMLLFAVKEAKKTGNFGKAWQDSSLFPIMNKTQDSRRFDFMIRNLCRGVKNVLSEVPPHTDSADALTKYLEGFLNRIRESCFKIAKLARDLVHPNDVLVVYGYCRNIAEFLSSLKPDYNNMLYMVDYQEPFGKVRLGRNQNRKMRSFANDVGFSEVRFVSLPSLAQALNELKRKQIPCKVLLGTHGALRSKGFLCKAGSYMIVNTAKDFGAQVIAFAEETKFLINGESDEDVASPEKLFSSETMCKRHPEMIDTMCLTSEIDFVPKELLVPKEIVDLVLTEKGAFPPDAVPTPAEKSGLVSEKKESNPV